MANLLRAGKPLLTLLFKTADVQTDHSIAVQVLAATVFVCLWKGYYSFNEAGAFNHLRAWK